MSNFIPRDQVLKAYNDFENNNGKPICVEYWEYMHGEMVLIDYQITGSDRTIDEIKALIDDNECRFFYD